jgi:hypothetical protein
VLIPCWTIDAVVLWDWVISLPREWRFVRSSTINIHESYIFYLSGLENSLDTGQGCLPVLPVRLTFNALQVLLIIGGRYWVIAVVPYLLYCFVMDHSLETCQKIYKVPVALAMWNQVGSECP